MDLKKILLKKAGGYTGFGIRQKIVKVVSLIRYKWGFKFAFLGKDGIIREVGSVCAI